MSEWDLGLSGAEAESGRLGETRGHVRAWVPLGLGCTSSRGTWLTSFIQLKQSLAVDGKDRSSYPR